MNTPKATSILDRARAYLRTDIEQLTRVADELDPAFEAAVHLLAETLRGNGKLVLAGIGKSYHLAAKAAATFTSTGSPAVLLHPAEAPHGDLGILRDGDAAILLSYSGESREVVNLVPFIRRANVRIIAITGTPESRLARLADLSIRVNIEREACPFNLAPTTSSLVTLAVCDTLAMLVQEELGFTLEAYGRLHPGGAIGDNLSLRVSDIMRDGDRLPHCREHDSVQEAVLVMTRCKSGAVGVLDENGLLTGIYTDGDLRRTLTQSVDLHAALLSEHMTRNPISISPDAKASEALKIFSRHNIDDLLVITSDRKLVGMVDLQDIPKLKFFHEDA
ncbi:MAG: KpsF/GutQ family sugar-phosphate isomerase [Verrucomicrobia bacterium]|nr:KpsF/GutQ family sugar-phosphate isomerase [Verrucomicrobiota bacterium]MCH8511110.1 KpsF/GutQ family sugar-phosphate isomerase [Kiritimatiellia bacterium]